MAQGSEPASLSVISGDAIRSQGVRSLLKMILKDHEEFSALLVVAVIPGPDPDYQDCRVYATNLNHLEKIGLLRQAEDTIK